MGGERGLLKPAYCLIIAITVPLLGMLIFFASVFGLSGLGDGQGENPGTVAYITTGESGPLSDDVPAVLIDLFKEPSKLGIATPAAVLAAISHRECGFINPDKGLWTMATKSPAIVKGWLTANEGLGVNTPPGQACNFDNGSRVWGAMQFQDTSFAIPEGADPNNSPPITPGSFGSQAEKFTKHRPASQVNVRDAVFAAALKLKFDSERHGSYVKGRRLPPRTNIKKNVTDWKKEDVYWAANHYQGDCSGGYCDAIVANWEKFSRLDENSL